MVKRGRSGKKEAGSSKRRTRDEYVASEEMDDEIDAFHKQRDVVPLNASDEDSDDDNEQPVLDFEGTDDEESDEGDDMEDTGLAAKIVRQQKYLRATMGEDDDELNEEEEDKEDKVTWGKRKGQFYNADQAASSDEDLPAEEEEEVLRLEKKRAEALSMEDFGHEDTSDDESDREPTLGEIAVRGVTRADSVTKRTVDDGPADFELVKKDLDALSKEEQMDVVYSSAPELLGLLSELNDATEELEHRINPLLSKVRDGGNITKEGIRYLEVKQILLLSYCQAITFYLLLKSEGQIVRDHPVIGRLVEIKNLLEKVRELDGNLPPNLEEILDENNTAKIVKPKVQGETALSFDSFSKDNKMPAANGVARELANALEAVKSAKLDSMNKKHERITENGQLGAQSMKMLKVRASLEEKLKQKGLLSSSASKEEKSKKQQKPLNGRLETRDDFDDDATVNLGANNGLSAGRTGVPNLLVAKQKKAKVISGDDDLPTRDDIGERRNKFERRVLQRAGVGSEDEADKDETDDVDANLGSSSQEGTEADESSEDEFYQQVKKDREAKLAAKADKFSRTTTTDEPSFPDTVDGKRHISYQMEKNRGLTRPRKKQDKNPRKKYRTKADKQMKRRGGQVQKIRKPSGPYGGEATGINVGISRSIRFKG